MLGFSLAMALAVSGQSDPHVVYLTCEISVEPKVERELVQRAVATKSGSLAKEIVEFGSISLFSPPSSTWIIDLANSTLRAPWGSAPIYSIISANDTNLLAYRGSRSGTDFEININRISGVVTHTIYLDQARQEAWTKKHGMPHPSHWVWEQRCDASQSRML